MNERAQEPPHVVEEQVLTLPRATPVPSTELPIVIRPRPMPLRRLESLLRRDRALARCLIEQPSHLHALATATLRRDATARERFADAGKLAAHLRACLAE